MSHIPSLPADSASSVPPAAPAPAAPAADVEADRGLDYVLAFWNLFLGFSVVILGICCGYVFASIVSLMLGWTSFC